MSSKNNINVGEQARLYDKQQPIELKKTKHFLISRRSASAPARLSHQNDRRSAMSTVFGINELLTQILSDVPMEHFVNLLRVSKTWNSVALKIGYYIEPTYVCTETYLPWIFQKPPVYPDNVHIDINPIVQCGNRYEAWNYELHRWDMNFRVDGKFFSSVLCRFGHQFLTNPPITHISIRYGDTHEALARNDGIRLRDMEEAFHKLRPCVTADVPREHRYQDYVFTASVVCSRSGSAKDVRERQDRMREEIFGWTSTVHWNYE